MLARRKGEIPFFVLLLPFLTGIGLTLCFQLSAYSNCLLIAFLVLLAAFTILSLFYGRLKVYRFSWLGGLLMHALLLLAGVVCAVRHDARQSLQYFEKHKADALLISINNEPQLKNGYLRFTADVKETALGKQRQHTLGKILITFPADTVSARHFAYGDVLLIPNKAAPVNPPFNPGEFNYKQYLAHQNVYSQAFLAPGEAVELAHNDGNPVVAYALRLRQKLVNQFSHNMQSPEAVALASTLILGYKAALGDDVMDAFSHTGTIHILSVSGGHVIILFTLIGWMLGFMDGWRYGRFVKAFITVAIIGYYTLLTGLSPAACRAAIMVTMLIAGKAFYRQARTLNLLAASAFLQLVFDPFLLADVGFQLSYLAVAGLVVFQPVIYQLLDVDNRWLDWLWKFCSASIAAQAITFPLAAYYFHQFPAYFLISNLFILPLAEAVMYLGLACLVFAQAGVMLVAKFMGSMLQFLILVMDGGLRRIEHLPYAYIDQIWITRLECLMLSAIVILLAAWLYYRQGRLLGWAIIFVLFFSGTFNSHKVEKMQHNGVTFLNLKKHTGIIFKQGESAVLVTDLADTDKTYRYSIKPGLDSNGIRRVITCKPNGDATTPWLVKRGNLMRFAGGDVLMIDKALIRPAKPVAVRYLYIAQSNAKTACPLIDSEQYQTIIIGAGVTKKNSIAMERHADSLGKKIFLMRSNYSPIFQSD